MTTGLKTEHFKKMYRAHDAIADLGNRIKLLYSAVESTAPPNGDTPNDK